MRKLSLSEWALVGELVASIGVIVSIVFLTYSINQSNKVTSAENDNLLYELYDSAYSGLIDNPDLMKTYMKIASGENPSEFEWWQWSVHASRIINIWELAFDRHQEGILSDQKWRSWDESLSTELLSDPPLVPDFMWESLAPTYGENFQNHVNAVYERQ